MTRSSYEIDLAKITEPSALDPRPVTHDDLDALARLMLDAYVGTIDYEGETLDDAVVEVRSFFDRDPLLDHSYAIEAGAGLASAALVSRVDGGPFIGYVMTSPAHKRTGLATSVAHRALWTLAQEGHPTVAFYITDGNVPSEALFARFGAVRTPVD